MRISDWSSDVCSSDLVDLAVDAGLSVKFGRFHDHHPTHSIKAEADGFSAFYHRDALGDKRVYFRRMFRSPLLAFLPDAVIQDQDAIAVQAMDHQIGRASCRERVCQDV